MVYVGRYSIHGAFGFVTCSKCLESKSKSMKMCSSFLDVFRSGMPAPDTQWSWFIDLHLPPELPKCRQIDRTLSVWGHVPVSFFF